MNGDLIERYERGLRRSRGKLPEGAPFPCPGAQWPEENVHLFERYRNWLLDGGAGELSCLNNYLPIAGYILGLNPIPYPRMDLDVDFGKVIEFVKARGSSAASQKMARLGMIRFRKFVRLELGLGEVPKFKTFNPGKYTQGLPDWLVQSLTRYQRSLQRNWRPQRVRANLSSFWSKHGKLWHFFCDQQGVWEFSDLKRAHILAFVDQGIEDGYAINTINCYILYLRGFLAFLQHDGYEVPQTLLRVKTLNPPDRLPQYLDDAQVFQLRDAIQQNIREASDYRELRQALLDQAIFYLLWQGGLRLSEVESLRLEDVDLMGKRISVRQGKGRVDRTVFLTPVTVSVLQDYLKVRGMGFSEHVFLYHNAALNKSYVWSRLKTLSKQTGVRVYAHRLRHTTATQLLNAGCKITSIQKILGHKNINTTMIYARAYNRTVAEDFYAAMERVERRMEISSVNEDARLDEDVNVQDFLEQLAQPGLSEAERLKIVESLREVVS